MNGFAINGQTGPAITGKNTARMVRDMMNVSVSIENVLYGVGGVVIWMLVVILVVFTVNVVIGNRFVTAGLMSATARNNDVSNGSKSARGM